MSSKRDIMGFSDSEGRPDVGTRCGGRLRRTDSFLPERYRQRATDQ